MKKLSNTFAKRIVIIVVLVAALLAVGFVLFTNFYDPDSPAGFEVAIRSRLIWIRDVTDEINEQYPRQAWDKVLSYQDEYISVHSFDDADQVIFVQAQLDKISNPIIDWVAKPHLFVHNELCVLYVGTNTRVLSALKDLLGEEIRHDLPYGGEADIVNVQVSIGGLGLTQVENPSLSDKRAVMAAVSACQASTLNWDGLSADLMPDKISLMVRLNSQDPDYDYFYVFLNDEGKPCLLAADDKRYCLLSMPVYQAVLSVARQGFQADRTLTVSAGGVSVTALGHWIYDYNRVTQVSADSMVLRSSQIALYIEYLPLSGSSVKDNGFQLTGSIGGGSPAGLISVYDSATGETVLQLTKVSELQDLDLSRLEHGRYIIEMRITFDSTVSQTGYQYFLGLEIQ